MFCLFVYLLFGLLFTRLFCCWLNWFWFTCCCLYNSVVGVTCSLFGVSDVYLLCIVYIVLPLGFVALSFCCCVLILLTGILVGVLVDADYLFDGYFSGV